MRHAVRPILIALLLAGSAGAVPNAVEPVLVKRCNEEEAVVQRANGDLWRLGLGHRCLPLASYSGRRVLVRAGVVFPGPEPHVLVPELDLDCRVLRADSVGRAAPPPERSRPTAGLAAMREALEALGYNCGPLEE